MAKSWKTPLFKALIIFLTAGWVLQGCSPTQIVSTSLISTPAQDKYTEAFIQYVGQLEKEGLTSVKEIRVEESQPFIFILKPESQEITDEDVENVTELALRTVSVFDSGGGL